MLQSVIRSCSSQFSPISLLSNFITLNTSFLKHTITNNNYLLSSSASACPLKVEAQHVIGPKCCARRRAIRDDEEDDEYVFNAEIALLETYTQLMKDEVLLVQAMVDDEQVEVLIFKGFSSSLSCETSPDPTRSVIPSTAIIKNIGRVKAPFDPSHIQYIEKGLTFDQFKNRLPR